MAKDTIRDAVKQALINDGWTITSEQYRLTYQELTLFADLSAERTLVAERDSEKILVEVKSFSGRSFIREFELALGQYQIYRNVIALTGLDFNLYLGISATTYNQLFTRPGTQTLVELNQVKLLVVDTDEEKVVTWIR